MGEAKIRRGREGESREEFERDRIGSPIVPEPLTPEEQAQADYDKTITVATETAAAPLVPTEGVSRSIENATMRMKRRMVNAGMEILNTAQYPLVAYDPEHKGMVYTFVIVCQWMGKEDLESLRRQQALMAQQGRGRA